MTSTSDSGCTSDTTCCILIMAPTNEQGMTVVTTWKLAEAVCEGCIHHCIHVCGKKDFSDIESIKNKYSGSKCSVMICLTAVSQEDWDQVKTEWNQIKEKFKNSRTIVAADKEEKSKKWFDDVKADDYVDLSKAEDCFKKLRKELVDYCKIKCKPNY
jgi:hypothetical protein